MSNRNLRTRFTRFVVAMAVGGSPFALSGCDPEVRSTVLSGLEVTTSSLANTLISAYFLSLDPGDGSSSLTTT